MQAEQCPVTASHREAKHLTGHLRLHCRPYWCSGQAIENKINQSNSLKLSAGDFSILLDFKIRIQLLHHVCFAPVFKRFTQFYINVLTLVTSWSHSTNRATKASPINIVTKLVATVYTTLLCTVDSIESGYTS